MVIHCIGKSFCDPAEKTPGFESAKSYNIWSSVRNPLKFYSCLKDGSVKLPQPGTLSYVCGSARPVLVLLSAPWILTDRYKNITLPGCFRLHVKQQMSVLWVVWKHLIGGETDGSSLSFGVLGYSVVTDLNFQSHMEMPGSFDTPLNMWSSDAQGHGMCLRMWLHTSIDHDGVGSLPSFSTWVPFMKLKIVSAIYTFQGCALPLNILV